MNFTLVVWSLGTGLITVVFARALHRWADRRTGRPSSVTLHPALRRMGRLDLTPSQSSSELTPIP